MDFLLFTNAQSQRREFALLCIRRRCGGGIVGRIFLYITGICGQGRPWTVQRSGVAQPAVRDTFARNQAR